MSSTLGSVTAADLLHRVAPRVARAMEAAPRRPRHLPPNFGAIHVPGITGIAVWCVCGYVTDSFREIFKHIQRWNRDGETHHGLYI